MVINTSIQQHVRRRASTIKDFGWWSEFVAWALEHKSDEFINNKKIEHQERMIQEEKDSEPPIDYDALEEAEDATWD